MSSLERPIFPGLEEFVSTNPFSYWNEETPGAIRSRVGVVGINAEPDPSRALTVGGDVAVAGDIVVGNVKVVGADGRVFAPSMPTMPHHAASKAYIDGIAETAGGAALLRNVPNDADLVFLPADDRGVFWGQDHGVYTKQGRLHLRSSNGWKFTTPGAASPAASVSSDGNLALAGSSLTFADADMTLAFSQDALSIHSTSNPSTPVLAVGGGVIAMHGGITSHLPSVQGVRTLFEALDQGNAETVMSIAQDAADVVVGTPGRQLVLDAPEVVFSGEVLLSRTSEEPPHPGSLATKRWVQDLIDSMDTSRWELAENGVDIHNRNSGRVGIGTAEPVDALHVARVGEAWARISQGDHHVRLGVDATGKVVMASSADIILAPGGAERIRFTQQGALVVGAEPRAVDPEGHVAHFAGDVLVTGDLHVGGSLGASRQWVQTQLEALDLSNWIMVGDNLISRSDGRVGIGTAMPLAKLHVEDSGTSSMVRITRSNGPGGVDFGIDDAGAAVLRQLHPERGISLTVAGTEAPRMFVSADGSVGFGTGTPDPAHTVHVAGSIRVDGPIVVQGEQVSTQAWVFERMQEIDTSNWQRLEGGGLSSRASGNVGIGTAQPQAKLHVHSAEQALMMVTSTHGGVSLGVDAEGHSRIANVTQGRDLRFGTAGSPTRLVLGSDGVVTFDDAFTTTGNLAVNTSAPQEGFALHVQGDAFVSGEIRVGHPLRVDGDNLAATKEWVGLVMNSIDNSNWQHSGDEMSNRNAGAVVIQGAAGLEVEGDLVVRGALLTAQNSGNLLVSLPRRWQVVGTGSVAATTDLAMFSPSLERFAITLVRGQEQGEAFMFQRVAWQPGFLDGKTMTFTAVATRETSVGSAATHTGMRLTFRGQALELLFTLDMPFEGAEWGAWDVRHMRAQAPAGSCFVDVGVFVSAGQQEERLHLSTHSCLNVGGAVIVAAMKPSWFELPTGEMETSGPVHVPYDTQNPGPRFMVGRGADRMGLEQHGRTLRVLSTQGDVEVVPQTAVGRVRILTDSEVRVQTGMSAALVVTAPAGREDVSLKLEGSQDGSYHAITSFASDGRLDVSHVPAPGQGQPSRIMAVAEDSSILLAEEEEARVVVGSAPEGASPPTHKLTVVSGAGVRVHHPSPASGGVPPETVLELTRHGGISAAMRIGELPGTEGQGAGSKMDLVMRDGLPSDAHRHVMTWTSAGRVGINTDAPTHDLHVDGTVRVTGQVFVGDTTPADMNALVTRAWVEDLASTKADEGDHLHVHTSIIGLSEALQGKAAVQHGHSKSDIAGLQEALDEKADVGHAHAISDVSGLEDVLDLKAPADHSHHHMYVSLDGTEQTVQGVKTFAGAVSMGASHRQSIDLWGSQYGIGTQEGGVFLRTPGGFAVYRGGQHVNAAFDAGEGGQTLFVVDTQGRVGVGGVTAPQHALHVQGSVQVTGGILVGVDPQDANAVTRKSWVETQLAQRAPLVHTHEVSDVTGLADMIAQKAPLAHTHTVDDIDGFGAVVAEKADAEHGHVISDVAGLQDALDARADAVHTHPISDVDGLQAALDGKAAIDHLHDDRYVRLTTDQVVGGTKTFADDIVFAPGHRLMLAMGMSAASGVGMQGGGMFLRGASGIAFYVGGSGGGGAQMGDPGEGGSVAMIIDQQGRVGLGGTTTPQHTLDVAGDMFVAGGVVIPSDPAGPNSLVRRAWVSQQLQGYALETHAHTISDIQGLQDALDLKSDAGHGHQIADIAGLREELDDRALMGHLHDDRYVRLTTDQFIAGNKTFSGVLSMAGSHRDMVVFEPAGERVASVGTQPDVMTLRSNEGFAFFAGGEAAAQAYDPGEGGGLLMVVRAGGRVGINGVVSPQHNLEVDGTLHATGDVLSDVAPTTDASLTRRDWVDARLAEKAEVQHGHAITEVEGLFEALADKSDVGHLHSIAEVTGLQEALDGKAEVDHLHDDRYVRMSADQTISGQITFSARPVMSQGLTSGPAGLRIDGDESSVLKTMWLGTTVSEAERPAMDATARASPLLFETRSAPGGDARITWTSSDGSAAFWISPEGIRRSGYSAPFTLRSPADHIRLQTPGNVGISSGELAPTAKLHVVGDGRVTGDFLLSDGSVVFEGGARELLRFGGGTAIGTQSEGTTYVRTPGHFALFVGGQHSDTPLDAGSGGSLAMVIAPSGHVGINVSSPTQALDVDGSIRADEFIEGEQPIRDLYAAKDHGHTIAEIIDLRETLDGKSDIGHRHTISDISGLQLELDAKADVGHIHMMEEVDGLLDALAAIDQSKWRVGTAGLAPIDAALPLFVGSSADEALPPGVAPMLVVSSPNSPQLMLRRPGVELEAEPAEAWFHVQDAGGNARMDLSLRHGSPDSPGVTPLSITSTGRVGIDTTAPETTLHVAGDLRVDSMLHAHSVQSSQGFNIGGDVLISRNAADDLVLEASQGDVVVVSRGDESLRVSPGHVLIGRPAPSTVAAPQEGTVLTLAANGAALALASPDGSRGYVLRAHVTDASDEGFSITPLQGDASHGLLLRDGALLVGVDANPLSHRLSVAGTVRAQRFVSSSGDITTLFAPVQHQHDIEDVSGLQAALSGKAQVGHTHVLHDVWDGTDTLDVLLSRKAPRLHHHDDDYVHLTRDQEVGGTKTFTGQLLVTQNIVHPDAATRREWVDAELAKKADNGHDHIITDVLNLREELDDRALVGHTHLISHVHDLQDQLDSKSNVGHAHPISEIINLREELDNRSLITHTHDDLYVRRDISQVVNGLKTFVDGIRILEDPAHGDHLTRRSWVQSQLDLKANATHFHTMENIIGLGDAVANKAASDHTHAVEDFPEVVAALATVAEREHRHVLQDVWDGTDTLDVLLSRKAPLTHSHDDVYVGLTGSQLVGGIKTFTGDVRILQQGSHATSVVTRAWVLNELTAFAPAGHEHQISDIAGLQERLDDLIRGDHGHEIEDIENLPQTLASKALVEHQHTIADVTDLPATLQAKADRDHDHADTYVRLNPGPGVAQIVSGDLEFLGDVRVALAPASSASAVSMQWLTDRLAERAEADHDHTVADIDGLQSLLDLKAAADHEHDIEDVAGLPEALDDRALVGHDHDIGHVIGLQQALDSKADDNHDHEGQYMVLTGDQQVEGLKVFTSGARSLVENDPHPHAVVRRDWAESQLAAKAPAEHTHVLEDLPALETALAGKAPAVHEHVIGDVRDLQQAIDGMADREHVHEIDHVSGLRQALDNKAELVHDHDDEYVSLTASQNISGVKTFMSDVRVFRPEGALEPPTHASVVTLQWMELRLAGKSAVVHEHEMSDVNGLTEALVGKAPLVHQHIIAQISNLQAVLDSKAPILHNHTTADVIGLDDILANKSPADHAHPGMYVELEGDQIILGIKTFTGDVRLSALSTHPASAITRQWAQQQLDGKVNAVHMHDIEDVSGLSHALAQRAHVVHMHDIEDVSGLQTALEERANVTHVHTIPEISGLQTALDLKSDVDHRHDDMYVTRDTTDAQEILGSKTFTSTVSFGSNVRQMINLNPTATMGIGVQSHTLYLRTPDHVAFYRGGSHVNDDFASGGGRLMMVLRSRDGQTFAGINNISDPQHTLSVAGTVHATGAILCPVTPVTPDALTNRQWVLAQLALRAEAVHTHPITEIEGLESIIQNLAVVGHQHDIAHVNGLQIALDNRADKEHRHEIEDVNGLEAALLQKALVGHTHDDRYVRLEGNQTVRGVKRFTDSILFGDQTRQMITLWSRSGHSDNYGIGVQSGTLYFRTGNRVGFYRGGVHHGTSGNPGAGGSVMMFLRENGRVGINGIINPTHNLHVAGTIHATGAISSATPIPTSADHLTPKGWVDTQLSLKAAASHDHEIDEIINLENALDEKADRTHQHSISDIDGLQDELNQRSLTSHNHDGTYLRLTGGDETVSGRKTFAVAPRTGVDPQSGNDLTRKMWVDAQVAAKAHIGHTHLDTEISGLTGALQGLADAEHTHTLQEIVGQGGVTLDVILDGKADVGHNHHNDYLRLANVAQTVQGVKTFSGEMRISSSGRLGVNVAPGAALTEALQVDNVSMLLNNGNNSQVFGAGAANQLVLGWRGSSRGYNHVIRTRHNSGNVMGNALDFYVWNRGVDGVQTMNPTRHAMTLDGGRVGMGTEAPRVALDVHDARTGTGAVVDVAMFHAGSAGAANVGARVYIGGGGWTTQGGFPHCSAIVGAHTSDGMTYLAFETNPAVTVNNNRPLERMRITSEGFVGIGTSVPQEMLHVEGTIRSTGDYMCGEDPSTPLSLTRRSWVEARLEGKADREHVHTISDVPDLQQELDAINTALDSKADAVHMHTMDDIVGFPSQFGSFSAFLSGSFADAEHRHSVSDIDDVDGTPFNVGSFAREGHVHTVDDISDLDLQNLAPANHEHSISDIDGLQYAIDNKAESGHEHVIADIDGLEEFVQNAAPAQHVHDISEISGLQAALDGKAATVHGHSITQIANLQQELNDRSLVGHTHTAAEIGNVQEIVDTRAPASHDHSVSDIPRMQEWADRYVTKQWTSRVTEPSDHATALASGESVRSMVWMDPEFGMVLGVTTNGRIFTVQGSSLQNVLQSSHDFRRVVRFGNHGTYHAYGNRIVQITQAGNGTVSVGSNVAFSNGVITGAVLSGGQYYLCTDGGTVFRSSSATSGFEALPNSPGTGASLAGLIAREQDTTIVAFGGNQVFSSQGGDDWFQRTISSSPSIPSGIISGSLLSGAWAEEIQLFCIVGDMVTLTSHDGIAWSPRHNPIGVQFRDVVWAAPLSRFVAVADPSGGQSPLWASLNGRNWQPMPNVNSARVGRAIAWGRSTSGSDRFGLAHAVGSAGGARIHTVWYRPMQFLPADQGMLSLDQVNGRVGVRMTGPQHTLDIFGTLNASEIRIDNQSIDDRFASISHNHTVSDITDASSHFVFLSNTAQTIAGAKTFSGTVSFGAQVRQMINLWNTSYGIGVQSNTTYFRTNNHFAFFRGGVHHDTTFNAGSGGMVQMVIQNVNNVPRVGVFTENPQYTLDVNGIIHTTEDVITSSDERLKTDIRPITEPLEKLSHIKGVTFKRKDDKEPGRTYTGVIAQDVRKVLPEAVHEDERGYMSVAYASMAGIIIEGIKELGAMLRHCEERLDASGF